MRFGTALAIAAVLLPAPPAAAQVAPRVGVEAATDEVRRGLSWTDGRASVSGEVSAGLAALDISARAVALRGAARHGGADGVADLTLGIGHDVGPLSLRAIGVGHLFAGARERMDYVEGGVSAGIGYGPAYLTAGLLVAPAQRAIGGSNVYLYANASAGIPATPFTVLADLGRSSGSVDDPLRAQRLRPGGAYTNWRIALEHRRDRLTLGVDYVGTDIHARTAIGPFAASPHLSDRIVGRAAFTF